jgi:hypothetical protein
MAEVNLRKMSLKLNLKKVTFPSLPGVATLSFLKRRAQSILMEKSRKKCQSSLMSKR